MPWELYIVKYSIAKLWFNWRCSRTISFDAKRRKRVEVLKRVWWCHGFVEVVVAFGVSTVPSVCQSRQVRRGIEFSLAKSEPPIIIAIQASRSVLAIITSGHQSHERPAAMLAERLKRMKEERLLILVIKGRRESNR